MIIDLDCGNISDSLYMVVFEERNKDGRRIVGEETNTIMNSIVLSANGNDMVGSYDRNAIDESLQPLMKINIISLPSGSLTVGLFANSMEEIEAVRDMNLDFKIDTIYRHMPEVVCRTIREEYPLLFGERVTSFMSNEPTTIFVGVIHTELTVQIMSDMVSKYSGGVYYHYPDRACVNLKLEDINEDTVYYLTLLKLHKGFSIEICVGYDHSVVIEKMKLLC